MAEEIAEVTVRSAEEEERRIAEKLHREAEDELQVERKKRARKLHEDVEAAEKELATLERVVDPNRKKEILAKRRKIVDLKYRAESADAAVKASEEIQETHSSKESERERLIRTGQITPFQPKEEVQMLASISEGDTGITAEQDFADTVAAKQEVGADDTDDLNSAEGAKDTYEDVVLEGGLHIPGVIHERLFPYQRTGVRWLWELHCQECGGIIGDEMGLGKTVQVIAFLAALDYSEKLTGPVLVVVPATLLQQWQRELSAWWPSCEAQILHQSSTAGAISSSSIKKVIKTAAKKKGVIITTYEMVRRNRDSFIVTDWMYVILDEGHRIRNPDSDITLACKRFDTPHRIVMTGSPLQNRLRELWSLFDFVFPGKLGTLPVFEREFSIPISTGGYATASAAQIHTAYHCAVILRDLITPYILRRMKKDVSLQIPGKKEQILMCRLTDEQKEKYKEYLSSRDVKLVLNKQMNMLAAVTVLRKICNHPDLVEEEKPADYGNWRRSGKLRVLNNILKTWRDEGSRVLLFAQTTTLLDLLEKYVRGMEYSYLRMDGTTPISKRMAMIDQFNNDDDVFLFLLTTKVGGFGVNLVGANRVVLYEPDWNPSNDLQARERAWRIGQKRDVIVYRLVTSGTIEEKIYHRQIYKQFLSSKVLNDPKQRRFFKAKDLNDLFTYTEENSNGTETGDIFAGMDVQEVKRTLKESEKEGSEGGEIDEREDNGSPKAGRMEEGEEAETKKGGDAAILKKLFDSDGLYSAIDHDHIMRAGETTIDLDIIQHEASRIAKQAAKELRNSRRERREQALGIPTWTGRSGSAGRPDNPRVFGSSSGRASSLLSSIKKRAGTASTTEMDDNVRLMESIRAFLQNHGGESSTVDIVEHFKDEIAGKNMITFKALLQRVAKMEKNGPIAKWILLESFKD